MSLNSDSNNNNDDSLEFEGKITRSSDRLRMVYIPSKLHKDIDKKFLGKKVKVTIAVL